MRVIDNIFRNGHHSSTVNNRKSKNSHSSKMIISQSMFFLLIVNLVSLQALHVEQHPLFLQLDQQISITTDDFNFMSDHSEVDKPLPSQRSIKLNKKKHINKRKEAMSLAQVSSVDSEADSDDPEESLSKEELAEIQK